ncbi:facilitated trehalose transporter Tret1 isoform X2 [Megachile rotundata]|uniref:facilitated trehalose transporter Tret1 isoform X2 n=1 Tax=Megachile rotundata TaxID=143995 RepID=UPI003FD57FF4
METATMTEEICAEKLPATKKIRRNQIIAGAVASLTLISCGLCFAWPTVYLQNGKRAVPVPPDMRKWVDSALLVGASLGPILSGLLIDRIGRKWFLYLIVTPFLASWILIFFAKNFTLFFVARLVGGLSVGAIYTVVPIYNGEIAETGVRGTVNAIAAVALNLGYIFTYGVGPLLDRKDLAVINLIPVMIFGLTFVWMPESPYYYLKKQRQRAAEVSLTWLRSQINNEQEIDEIKAFIESEEKGSIKKVFTVPTHRKALVTLMLLFAGQQISGLMAIQSFTRFLLPQISREVDIEATLIIIATIILVGSAVTVFVADRFGRKPILLLSAYTVALTLLAAGAYSFVRTNVTKLDNLPWLPLVIIGVHCFVYSFGLGSIPTIVSSEIFPMKVKSLAVMVANIFSFLVALVVTICYPFVVDAYGYYIVFFVFGVLELIVAIATTIIMPETSQKPFIKIQEILKESTDNKVNEPSTSTAEPVKVKEDTA